MEITFIAQPAMLGTLQTIQDDISAALTVPLVKGNSIARPTISLNMLTTPYGPVTITNLTTGDFISFNPRVWHHTFLGIDNKLRYAQMGTMNVSWQITGSEAWIALAPGVDNLLTFSNVTSGQMVFTYRGEYI
jgi:hypothetical protein